MDGKLQKLDISQEFKEVGRNALHGNNQLFDKLTCHFYIITSVTVNKSQFGEIIWQYKSHLDYNRSAVESILSSIIGSYFYCHLLYSLKLQGYTL